MSRSIFLFSFHKADNISLVKKSFPQLLRAELTTGPDSPTSPFFPFRPRFPGGPAGPGGPGGPEIIFHSLD